MRKYRVTIESNFVHLPTEAQDKLYGYFSTFETEASDAKNAIQQVQPQLLQCIASKGISERSVGVFRTHYIIDEVWEVVEEPLLSEFVGGGLVCFRIHPLSAVASLVRFMAIRLLKPNLVFESPRFPAQG